MGDFNGTRGLTQWAGLKACGHHGGTLSAGSDHSKMVCPGA